jgi:outer membrane receptor protein involved in Fe transport
MFRKFLIITAVVLLGTSGSLYAQTATLSGTVTDSSGAVIPEAQATVVNTETGAQRVVVSDPQGRFTVPQLQPGKYQVTISKEGFETLIRSGITLTVGQDASLPLQLTVGSVNQQVTITAEAPLVDTSASAVTGVVNEERIQDLPLNGRDFTQLALIEPGILPARKTDSTVQKGFGARISIAGSRPDQTGWLLDGTNVKSMSNFGTPGSASGLMLGVDAIREFQVLTSNYSAEYGGSSGGMVNMVTKSGTNQLHGTAYEFLRNDNFDAARWEDNKGKGKPEFKRNQYGFSLGGPIKKDRTFIFGNYESLRERKGNTNISDVPDFLVHQGLVNSGPGGTLVQVNVAASIRPYLDLWPTPNIAGSTPGGTGQFAIAASEDTDQHYWMTRADHRVSDSGSLFARFTMDQGDKTRPYSIPITNADITTRTRYATVQYDHIWSPTMISNSRVAYNRTNLGSDVSLNIDYPANLFILNKRVPPNFSYTGVSTFGPGDRDIFKNVQNLYQVQQNFVNTRSSHSMKWGFDYQKLGTNTDGGPRDNGSFTWGNATAFLTDATIQSWAAQVPGGQSQRSFVQHVFGFYVQDDWKWRPNFTWNLGLRYEPSTTPTEKWNRIAVVKDWVHDTAFSTNVPFWENPTKKNFSPRVGFNWSPGTDGKTALRGGFGIFYVMLNGAYFRTPGVKNPPFSAFLESNVTNSNLASAAADLARIAPVLLDPKFTPSSFMEIYQYDLDTSYETKFNLTLERELPGNFSFSLGYLGGRANHLWRSSDANAAPSQFSADGREFVAPGTPRLNPAVGVGTIRYSDAKAFYNAMLFGIKKRLSQGFTFQSSFTWSKTVDDATTGLANTDYNEGVAEYPYGPKSDRGLSGIHLGRNLTLNGVWAIPSPGGNSVLNYVAGGWQLSGIFTASDGTPFSVINSGRLIPNLKRSTGSRPDLAGAERTLGNIIDGTTAGCGTATNGTPVGGELGSPDLYFDPCAFVLPPANTYGNSGRNILIGPGFVNFDLNFKKEFGLGWGEGRKLEFSGGLFNLFNHPAFGIPLNTIFNGTTRNRESTVGQIRDTKTDARELQLGLKLVF